jgi:hypothetical protein
MIDLRDEFLKLYHNYTFYEYQKGPSDKILDSVINNKGEEIFIMCSRQVGKTDLVAKTSYILALTYFKLTGRPIRIGVFSPSYHQSEIMFTRIRDLFDSNLLTRFGYLVEINNGNTIKLSTFHNNRKYIIATIHSRTAAPDTNIKGYTFDVILLDEAENIDDRKIKEDIIPMGSAVNATRVLIGTPVTGGRFSRYFYEGVLNGKNVFIVDYIRATKQNPAYKAYIDNLLQRVSPDSDEFRTQYLLEWVIERSKFINPSMLKEIEKDYETITVKKVLKQQGDTNANINGKGK